MLVPPVTMCTIGARSITEKVAPSTPCGPPFVATLGVQQVPQTEIELTDSTSGYVQLTGFTYTAATGWANCQTTQHPFTGAVKYAFFQFDTSVLPDWATVTQVEFYQKLATVQPSGTPIVQELRYYIGDFIGAALNGDAGEYTGGTYMIARTDETDDIYLDLAAEANDPTVHVNKAGTTDVRIADFGSGGFSLWGTHFNTAKVKCKLRVTWEGAYRLPLLGAG